MRYCLAVQKSLQESTTVNKQNLSKLVACWWDNAMTSVSRNSDRGCDFIDRQGNLYALGAEDIVPDPIKQRFIHCRICLPDGRRYI